VYPIVVPTPRSLRTFNFYLLQEAGSLTLIDAGVNTEECWRAFVSTMAINRFAIQDLDRIIVTHSHPDHIGIINRITFNHDIPIYAHYESLHRLKRNSDYLKLRIRFFREFYQSMGCGDLGLQHVKKLKEAVSTNEHRVVGNIVPLNDGDIVAGMQVIETLGHSPDHIALGVLQRKWLFAGDLIIGHISSSALIEPDQTGRRLPSFIQHVASLQKCLQLDMATAFAGHGEPIYPYKELISKRLQQIYRRVNRIWQLIASGISMPSELGVALYKDLYVSEFPFVMSEIIGCLDYLEMHNKVGKKQIGHVWHYYVL
jgi:glyoxylase-like metal-dependent hydrolase (beta-lactamase superfamily II)